MAIIAGEGGLELATLAGLRRPPPGFDIASSQAYYQAAWRVLRNAKTRADLDQPSYYVDPAGKRFRLRLDQVNVEAVLADAGSKWTSWVEGAATQLRELEAKGAGMDVEELRELVRRFLLLDGMTEAALDKIDLAVRVIALRTLQAARPHVVVPAEVWAAPREAVVGVDESAGVVGLVLERVELRLGERVVVGDARSQVAAIEPNTTVGCGHHPHCPSRS